MKSIIFSLILMAAPITFAQEIAELSRLVNLRTLGIDAVYGKALSPSQSLETEKSKFERIQSSNAAMLAEVEAVSNAFVKQGPPDMVLGNVYNTVDKYDSEVSGKGGHILFLGTNPSAAQSRNLFMISKAKLTMANPTAAVLNVLTSYKRSAKTADFIYAYAQPFDLKAGKIVSYEGTETSWLKPEAQAPFENAQDYVLKKCRKLLGWRCITSLYRTDSIPVGSDTMQVLFIAMYDLDANADHDDFAKDKRSKNQITGSTAIYIVKETADWMMIYGTDHQYNNDKTTFQDSIQNEMDKDVGRFKERLSADLGISVKDIK
ncbi:MAG: hypothetical protein H7256_12020 [Bdellovibrio sp.]|nr:hypothetical protein [Bdellovibrio sp.]